MELTPLEFVIYGTIAVFFVAHLFVTVVRVARGEQVNTPEEDFLNTRVGKSGVRVGAALDAMNSRSRGRRPTDWR